ncbi:MAG: hypothetical protein B9S34_15415 [Opitutia bacterium Tous-C1TDCM]|nr:MAG: hypothetical protein B9S34_15415 [Opitutae bacterium Tous-C1TDCM]
MTLLVRILAVVLPVAGAELAAKWWTEPPPPATGAAVLTLNPPPKAAWKLQPNLYREVQPSLRSSSGWIANVVESDGPGMRLACFSWDQTTTINTLEAFKHLPEECMGAIGMDLEKVHPFRVFQFAGGQLVFDSTLFRPRGGGQAIHVFKAVWVSGLESVDLREDVILGSTGNELRQLRLAAAATRFKPAHTRVIMGAVAGMPSEDLAWHRFSNAVLGQLDWTLENEGR